MHITPKNTGHLSSHFWSCTRFCTITLEIIRSNMQAIFKLSTLWNSNEKMTRAHEKLMVQSYTMMMAVYLEIWCWYSSQRVRQTLKYWQNRRFPKCCHIRISGTMLESTKSIWRSICFFLAPKGPQSCWAYILQLAKIIDSWLINITVKRIFVRFNVIMTNETKDRLKSKIKSLFVARGASRFFDCQEYNVCLVFGVSDRFLNEGMKAKSSGRLRLACLHL